MKEIAITATEQLPLELMERLAVAEKSALKIDLAWIAADSLTQKANLWTKEQILALIPHYKKFLILKVIFGNKEKIVPPTKIIAEFWKWHWKRDKGGYYSDTIRLGRFVHCPLAMIRTKKQIERTRELWKLCFDEEPPAEA